MFTNLIISNSTGDAKVSLDGKHVSLNSVEMCINDAQDSREICMWCNSAAIKTLLFHVWIYHLICAPYIFSNKQTSNKYTVWTFIFIIQRIIEKKKCIYVQYITVNLKSINQAIGKFKKGYSAPGGTHKQSDKIYTERHYDRANKIQAEHTVVSPEQTNTWFCVFCSKEKRNKSCLYSVSNWSVTLIQRRSELSVIHTSVWYQECVWECVLRVKGFVGKHWHRSFFWALGKKREKKKVFCEMR